MTHISVLFGVSPCVCGAWSWPPFAQLCLPPITDIPTNTSSLSHSLSLCAPHFIEGHEVSSEREQPSGSEYTHIEQRPTRTYTWEHFREIFELKSLTRDTRTYTRRAFPRDRDTMAEREHAPPDINIDADSSSSSPIGPAGRRLSVRVVSVVPTPATVFLWISGPLGL